MEDARDAVLKKDDRNQQGREIEFADPVKFLSTVAFSELPETPVLDAQPSATTISVLNTTRIKLQNTGAVTVTSLLQGQQGQNVLVLGDGFTSFAVSGNITTSTGSAKLLAASTIYSFTFIGTKWVEQNAGASNPYTGKHVTIFGDGTSHVQVSAGNYEQYGVGFNTVCDATSMTQYRFMARVGAFTSGTSTTVSLRLAYSTNGTAWTTITATTLTFNAFPSFQVSAFGALPSGAAIATAYFRIEVNAAAGGDVTQISHAHLELKP